MKLIVGLGNPREKYQGNRHNVGVMFIDYLTQSSKFKAQNDSSKFKTDKYIESAIAEINLNSEKVILAKPTTFMNESGRAIKKIIFNFSVLPADRQFSIFNDLYIIHDDLDIRLGEFKIQKGKGPQLHNGIESIESALGTKDFFRVRVGVDNRSAENRIPGEKYVLQDFNKEEIELLNRVFEEIIEKLVEI